MKAVLERISDDGVQTLGELAVYDSEGIKHYTCKTLELPWRDNKQQISCIPTGKYRVIRRYSAKYKTHFHIQEVSGRSLILIHPANFHSQLLGCIAVGDKHTDINGDGRDDVTSSKRAMSILLSILDEDFTLLIKNKKQKMKLKDIIKSVAGGAKDALPTISIKKNKEEDNGTPKGKLNLPKLITAAVLGLAQSILVAKGVKPEFIDGLFNLLGL